MNNPEFPPPEPEPDDTPLDKRVDDTLDAIVREHDKAFHDTFSDWLDPVTNPDVSWEDVLKARRQVEILASERERRKAVAARKS